jgi:ABC-type bacteriocin/lantibiotic exporter with double-glycine peptidase domain
MMGYSVQARTTSGRIVRLALAALTFFSIFMLLIRMRSPLWVVFVQFLPVILIALPILAYVFRPIRKQSAAAAAQENAEKPKRGESLSELMSILNDEDIDDLRARVKARLEEQIDTADASEMETFEELLAEHKRKRQ